MIAVAYFYAAFVVDNNDKLMSNIQKKREIDSANNNI